MFDEKLVIKQFLENQKLALPANLNAANLTLVMRSLGFFLNEFDVAHTDGNPNPDEQNLSIEIKCGHTGIISKLYLPHQDCACLGANPPKEKAYWEVHGNQPTSPSTGNRSTIVHETATNLLPEADHTWKILTRNMFNFILRMENGIAQYKDDQNNMQYGEAVSEETPANNVEVEETVSDNEEVPVFFSNKPDTPYSTPLSSINVTPMVMTSGPDVIITGPSNSTSHSLMESTSSSYQGESLVISLLTDARTKLDQALLRIKFNSTEDLFNKSGVLKFSAEPTVTPSSTKILQQPSKNLLRRRSTNSSISSNISSRGGAGATSKVLNRVPGRLSTGSVSDTKKILIEKKIKSPTKRPRSSIIVPTQTRTSALRNQNLKSKN